MAACKESTLTGSDNSVNEELIERHTGAAEAPEKTVTRKRKQQKMETEDDVKRPSFPPISADKLMVGLSKISAFEREDIYSSCPCQNLMPLV